jgi:hypothetical protein
MSDQIKFEGIEGLDKAIDGLVASIKRTPANIVKVLSTVRNQMVFDTTSGIDVNGRPFTPYSIRYRALRQENSRQASPVSLTYTGGMLRSMKVFNVSNGGEIRFDSGRENDLAVRHNTGKGVPKREFFGLNSRNLDYIEKRLAEDIRL